MQLDASSGEQMIGRSGDSGARGRRLESTFFMINVIFLLLLFFVVAGNLNMNIAVSPPRSDAEQAMALADAQLVIDAAGRLQLNGSDVALQDLNAAARALGRVPSLSIAADAGVDAVLVAQALAALAGLPLDQVTLVTLGRASGAPPSRPQR